MENIKSSAGIILATIIGGSMYLGGQYLDQQDLDPVQISVQGEGKVMANPDIAQVSFGVTTGREKSAEGAMKTLSTKMNAVVAAVKAQGIEDKDVQTQSLSLNPAYDWDDGKRINQGFEARQNLSVKIRDLDSIGKVLSAVAAAGSNQIGGVSFTIDDPEILRAEAREKAIANAKEKARALAKQLGKRVGELRGFNEGGGYAPRLNYAKAEMMMDTAGVGGGGAVPVPTGEQEVNVTVSLTYELN